MSMAPRITAQASPEGGFSSWAIALMLGRAFRPVQQDYSMADIGATDRPSSIAVRPTVPRLAGQVTRLELEVAVALTGLVQAAALLDLTAYPLLRCGDLAGGGQHVGQAAGRDHHHPVAVADDHVSGLDAHLAQRDGHLVAVRPHAVFARPHEDAAAEDRIAELEAAGGVAANPMDHRAGKAPAMGDDRQDVTPDGGVEPAAVVQHNDAAGRHLVYVVAHAGSGAGRHRDGTHRESRTYQPETAVQWSDAEGLAGDPQAVHGIAKRRGGVTPELFDLCVQSISPSLALSPERGRARVPARLLDLAAANGGQLVRRD